MPLNLKSKKKPATPTSAGASLEEATAEATAIWKLVQEKKAAEAALKLAQKPFVEKVVSHRRDLLQQGTFASHVKVPTEDGKEVRVQFSETFRPLDPDDVPLIREAFGDKYDLLAEEIPVVRVRDGVSADQIKDTIGAKAWNKLVALLDETTTEVRPRKGATEQVAKFFAKGEDELGENALEFVEACLSRGPSTVAK
jgi:hypothetical protein